MIKTGRSKQAYAHLVYAPRGNDTGDVNVHTGMCIPVWELLTEQQLVAAASTIARHSRAGNGYAEIGGWHVGNWTQEITDAAKYDPELVARLQHEAATVAAEEWLHIAQSVGKVSLAGQNDVEVDVAAYLDGQGVHLSDDFLTRYSARAAWYIAEHPERADAITAFSEQHGRY